MYGTVERVEWLTPHLVRVLFGGERLDGLAVEEGLDRRVRQPAGSQRQRADGQIGSSHVGGGLLPMDRLMHCASSTRGPKRNHAAWSAASTSG